MLKIASHQYRIEVFSTWDQYQNKIEHLVKQAKQQNVQLLLLPEYAGVEICFGEFSSEEDAYIAMQPYISRYLTLFQELAVQYQMYIQPGTVIEKINQNDYINRAYFFGPNGQYGFQDKLQLTTQEKQLKFLQRGNTQTLFNTAFGKIGITICYDSEFPEYTRNLVAAGANLILVPSYTVSLAGFNRVFLSCRARAIENQCYIAIAYVTGTVTSNGEPDQTVGQAHIVGPADIDFPDDGILARGVMNDVCMTTTELSFEKLSFVRQNGNVHNFEDSMVLRGQSLPLSHLTL